MHKVDTPQTETAAVRIYLDESGTADPNTPQAVVGGLIINSSHYFPFEDAWGKMLNKHGIPAPLHMNEFGKHGKCAGISVSARENLFRDVTGLINGHKICSITAAVTNSEFEALAEPMRKVTSVYAMCFTLAVMMNHKIAVADKYPHPVSFILDKGNRYMEHITKAYQAANQLQSEGEFLHLGDLAFSDDAVLGVLQAADVIAWGSRRLASGRQLLRGMEPIGEILISENAHYNSSWNAGWLKELEQRVMPVHQILMEGKDDEEDL